MPKWRKEYSIKFYQQQNAIKLNTEKQAKANLWLAEGKWNFFQTFLRLIAYWSIVGKWGIRGLAEYQNKSCINA